MNDAIQSLLRRQEELLPARQTAIRQEMTAAQKIFLGVGHGSGEADVLAALEANEALFQSHCTAMSYLMRYVSEELNSIGSQAYDKGDFLLSEYAFRMLALSGSNHGKIRLAALIRRGDLPPYHLKKYTCCQDALTLLRSGVELKGPFALVNAALLYVDLGRWHKACRLIKRIDDADIHIAGSYNCYDGKAASKEDGESLLVHALLLHTRRIGYSELGSRRYLREFVRETVTGVPWWFLF